MSPKIVLAVSVTATLLCGGCGVSIPRTYADPKEVTVKEALRSVADGVSEYNDELISRNVLTGNIVDQVEVTLNVTASAKGTSELVVEAKSPEALTVIPFGVKYTDGLETQGNRTSTVKLTLKNLYTASLNKAGEAVAKRDGPGFRKQRQYSSPIQRRTSAQDSPPVSVRSVEIVNSAPPITLFNKTFDLNDLKNPSSRYKDKDGNDILILQVPKKPDNSM